MLRDTPAPTPEAQMASQDRLGHIGTWRWPVKELICNWRRRSLGNLTSTCTRARALPARLDGAV